MTFIYMALLAAFPAFVSILGTIALVCGFRKTNLIKTEEMTKALADIKDQVKSSKEMEELKTNMLAMMESNRKLQTLYLELLTELTKRQHKEE